MICCSPEGILGTEYVVYSIYHDFYLLLHRHRLFDPDPDPDACLVYRNE